MDLPHHPAPQPQHSAQPSVSEMENPILHPQVHDDLSHSQWDWSEFLDFSFDDQFSISIEAEQHPAEPKLPSVAVNPDSPQRIRKRDPRLDCPNFMAGRIPCACPEMDAMLEEEEGVPGNKRVRTARPVSGTSRCQVPGCEVDISELKGYHRRHRVCLQCANASVVMLDGQRKRYCQQCGKFHFLSDFDEGKRSCRRKLERHNNRRRRKPSESKVAVESEPQDLVLADDLGCDDENAKESISLSSQIAEGEPLVESDEGQISTLCSNPGSPSIQNNSVVSFVPSGEAQIDGEKDEAKHPRSSSYSDTKSAYSSLCPTGRISFKLYDWNPAEFPRRLRHQIFQWLASMPVELEGYIRPGCTILTVFIAMPSFMWFKLLEDPVPYIHDFVAAPGTMLPGRGSLLVYLDNMVFRVIRDGTSVMQVKVEDQTPKLHYVHPTCFEAGKSIEFVACGSNLLQPKFRFLVSFAGKYLAYNCCVPPLCGDKDGSTASLDHQLLKIYIPITEPDLFGPAFIEVENESGLSNFIPILIGNKEICSEMKIMEHKFEASPSLKGQCATSSLPDSCKVSFPRQTSFSQFILDTAWLLRKPAFEDAEYSLTSSQIGRFNRLLTFLIKNKCTSILESVLCHMKIPMGKMKLNNLANGVADDDVKFLQSNLDHAKYILCQGHQGKGSSLRDSQNLIQKRDCLDESYHNEMLTVSFFGQDNETKEKGNLDDVAGSNSQDQSGNLPLLNREFVMSMDPVKGRPGKSCSRVVTSKYFASRPLMFVMAAATFCLGVCVVLSHPHKVGKIATTIRRCLFDNT